MHYDGGKRLYEQGQVEPRTGVVEYPVIATRAWSARIPPRQSEVARAIRGGAAYLIIEDTSMINGISRENPALDFALCIA